MQTFLPFPDFAQSARVLDQRRLGKQRVETLQIMNVLTGNRIVNARDGRAPAGSDPALWRISPSARGWGNHPMTRMWSGYVGMLLRYQHFICAEWKRRGFKDTCLAKTYFVLEIDPDDHDPSGTVLEPPWLGRPDLHLSHRSNLLRKDPTHYGPLFEDGLPDDLEYVWPV